MYIVLFSQKRMKYIENWSNSKNKIVKIKYDFWCYLIVFLLIVLIFFIEIFCRFLYVLMINMPISNMKYFFKCILNSFLKRKKAYKLIDKKEEYVFISPLSIIKHIIFHEINVNFFFLWSQINEMFT